VRLTLHIHPTAPSARVTGGAFTFADSLSCGVLDSTWVGAAGDIYRWMAWLDELDACCINNQRQSIRR